ncbi:MalY/PatB family protein [Streptomyces bohaiensis]|uniref:Aminotransferase n=2 Tax=Streptomyces bohaiensis TaxID=1431344 RepID=A0ABX1CK19_9ACTN|nr:aminotransferase class I/II-fold pyridoxal phosphate-dependent enzyme [Streptomyces bohaiensis]NJQ17604.1 aminotransferase class I/II-fold pyridoxal phosphate-dependent enzyme [Streptomyces bohaiensis]
MTSSDGPAPAPDAPGERAPVPAGAPPGIANPLRQLTLAELRRRTSEKWRAHPPDVLPLFVAEMDVPLPDAVARAVTEALALGDTGYTRGSAYAEAYAAFARRRWGWDGVAAERTTVVPDVMTGVLTVLAAISAPRDTVVVNSPVYTPFHDYVRHTGRTVVEAPLGEDHRLDLDVLADCYRRVATRGGTTVHLLCNPHNPTGTVHTAAELSAVAELAARWGVRVVVDEIHAPVVDPGTVFTPYLSLPGAETGWAVLSASKAWNLAGLRAGLAVAGPGAAAELPRIPEWIAAATSHIGVIAHRAAFTAGEPWLDALLAGLAENRRLLAALLAEHLPEVRYRPAPGTYLAWLDCRAAGLGDDPAAAFLERGRVALNSGPAFGTGGAGHVRLNLATSPEVLTEAVRRMVRARP